MQSDKDIIAWEKRLGDQAKRAWQNYLHKHIDLTTARVDEPLLIAGEYMYVEAASDQAAAIAKIKLNRNTNDALDLELGVEIQTVFTEIYITNDALDGEWLDLIVGINFVYKKKIAPEVIEAALNFLLGGPITTPPGVDLRIVPGAGGITQIGAGGATSHGLNNNDDLFVSGELEVDGELYIDGQMRVYGVIAVFSNLNVYEEFNLYSMASSGGGLRQRILAEELTIPIGQGAAGVPTAANLAPANSTMLGCVCRVTQAPGGGATTIDIGRTGGGNLDEFIDGIATALDTTGTFAANHDAATTGPVLNAAADTFTVTTDANVLVSDMKVRIVSLYRQELPPSS